MAPRPEGEIWNYQQQHLGFNYRISDLHCALGLSQLSRIDAFIERRHEIADRYFTRFADLPITSPWQHPDTWSSYHLFTIRVQPEICGKTQREVYDAMIAERILVNLHYIPVHRQPYYEKLGFKENDCPEAEKYHRECITLPMFPKLTDSEQDKVMDTLAGILA